MKANKEYIELLTTGLSAQTGVKIVEGKTWSANSKTKELSIVKKDLENLPFDVVRGLILHEIGHLLFTEPYDLSTVHAQNYGKDVMHIIYNSFEDMRIERRLSYRYGRYAMASLSSCDSWGVEQHLFNSGGDYAKLPKYQQFLLICLFRYYANYCNDYYIQNVLGTDACYLWRPDQWTYPVASFHDKVKQRHANKRQTILNIIDKCLVANNVAAMQRVIDTELIPIIKDFLEDKKDRDKNQQQNKQQQNKQGQGQGQQPQNGQPGQGKPGQPQQGQGQQSDAQGGTPMSMVTPGGKGFSTVSPKQERHQNIIKPTEREAKALLSGLSYTLAQRLKDTLKEKKCTRFSGLHKSGYLLSKNAYRVAVSGETRMFSKRTNPDTPEYEVFMALDRSGSMGGERAIYAFMGAVLLKDVCERLKFKIRIWEYDTCAYELDRLDSYDGTGGGTEDYCALDKINKKLNPDKDNLVFIVTDGETGRDYDTPTVLKQMKQKNATIYGIGIGGDLSGESLKRNYEHAVLVERVEELPMKLIALMRSIIHR